MFETSDKLRKSKSQHRVGTAVGAPLQIFGLHKTGPRNLQLMQSRFRYQDRQDGAMFSCIAGGPAGGEAPGNLSPCSGGTR